MIKPISAIVLCCFLYSCGSRESAPAGTVHADSSFFIPLPQADSFQSGWSHENTVVFHLPGEPDNLHPTNGSYFNRRIIFAYTQKYLGDINLERPGPRPDLIEALPEISADGLIYQYRLRNDITWDDGSPLTANDVVFTFKANKCALVNNPTFRPFAESVSAVVPDPENALKFSILLKKPDNGNMGMFSEFPIMQQIFHDPENILSKYSFRELEQASGKDDLLKSWADRFNDPDYGFDPAFLNGCGPYQVIAWEQGQQLILQRKKNHWTQKKHQNGRQVQTPYEVAYPERIIFRINRDANAIALDLKSQVYDGAVYLDMNTLLELRKDSAFNRNYHSEFLDTYSFSYAAFNTRPDGKIHRKLFTDKNVRRALTLLTPAEQIRKTVFHEVNKRVTGPVLPLNSEYNRDLKLLPFDPATAKQLLLKSGWKDTDGDGILDKLIDGIRTPFRFELSYMSNLSEWKEAALIMAESYRSAGIDVILKALDISQLYDKASDHDFDMLIGVWVSNSLPTDFSQCWHSSSWLNRGSNYSGFGNKESDALIDSINTAKDPVSRKALAMKLQEIIYEEQPAVFLFQGFLRVVIHKRFSNTKMFREQPGVRLNEWKLRKRI